MSITYSVSDGVVIEEIEAEDWDDAVDQAKDWVHDGEWGDDGCVVTAYITDPDGEEKSVTVTIEPNHDALIEAAGGDPDCVHEWTSEGHGGCEENPGVYGIGGSAVSIVSHCAHCGVGRREVTGCTNPVGVGNRDGVWYYPPEPDEDEEEEELAENIRQEELKGV